MLPKDKTLGQRACAVSQHLVLAPEIDLPDRNVFTAKLMCRFLHIPASTGFYHFITVS